MAPMLRCKFWQEPLTHRASATEQQFAALVHDVISRGQFDWSGAHASVQAAVVGGLGAERVLIWLCWP